MDVLMPQLGETVAEGTVSTWHKQVGDRVSADEILLDVETDKVSMEIPAPRAGRLAQILVEAGQTVEVGTVLAVIEVEGSEAAAGTTAEPQAAESAPEAASPPSGASGEPSAQRNAPGAAETAADGATRGSEGRLATDAGHAARSGQAAGFAPAAAERSDTQRLSPAVRRLVAEHRLDVQQIPATGRNGRVTRRNVIDFLEHRPAAPEPVAQPAARAAQAGTQAPARPARAAAQASAAPARAGQAAAAARPAPSAVPDTTVPFTRIRRLTAEHMVKSKATSPHVLQAVEVDFAGVDRVRAAMRESWRAQHGYSLTYLPFIAHAVCTALREFPNLNASVKEDALVLHASVNLAIAVDLGADGLVAPVIKSAEGFTVPRLADAIHEIAGRARANRLRPDDLSGGTYTLSNSGTFGTLITAPIINQPQVAILSTDGVRKKPVVIERPDGDSIAIRPVGILAQSFDHRAVDGAYSAAFLDRVRKLIELTDWFREI